MTYLHEFRIYESTIFFHEKCLFSFSNIFYLDRKILPCFKRKQEKNLKKIRGFVVGTCENMSRTC